MKKKKQNKAKEYVRFAFIMLALVVFNMVANAQEINFSRVQDMAIWYNQSLKTDKQMSLKLNYRNVNYQGLIAYNSICAILDAPILTKAAKEKTNAGYFSASVGAASDKSNQGILNNTLGMLGLSYSLPISANEIYASVGFQGMYYQSRLSTANVAFPDQFDSYGPLTSKTSEDALAGGWSYGYFNVNAGASVFSNSQYNKWYIGASVMHLNSPYTEHTKSELFKQKRGFSVQGGYKYITNSADECAFNMSLNWQGNAYKHYFNLSYMKALTSIENGGVGLGIGYRYNDAVIPSIDLKYNKATIGLLYDLNISSINAAGYKRTGLELALKLDF